MSIRNRIFAVFVLTVALGMYAFFNWMRGEILPRYMEAQEDILVDTAWLLASQIETQSLRQRDGRWQIDVSNLQADFQRLQQQKFSAQIYGLLKTSVDLRVYVTDAQGIAVFDSQPNRDLGKDMSEWRDVAFTLKGEYGARSSDDALFADGSTMYVAAPIRHAGDIVGVVSVGKTTRNAKQFLSSAVSRFVWAGAVVFGAALVLSFGLYWWVTRPLYLLQQYAQDLQAGKRVAAPQLGKNEVGRVGEAMAGLREALDGKAYIEEYVQTLTHELKSPTAAISGAAELLGEDLPAADRQRFLDNIRSESKRLNDLAERMLALAEIENRDALRQVESLDLRVLLDEALSSLAPQISRKQLQLEITGADQLQVCGEAFLLHRALVNLLDNAVDFSPVAGAIQIRLERSVSGQACLSIIDQGLGLPDYAQSRVFDRFYSLPRADGHKSSGLGLSFVRQIAHLHGGQVRLSNHPDGGACAELILVAA